MSRRRGISTIVVIVGFAITTLLATTELTRVAQYLRRSRQVHARWQARILVKSAYHRAMARWEHEPDYRGGEWTLAAGSFDVPGWRADVRVVVERESGESSCRIRVVLRSAEQVLVTLERDYPLVGRRAREAPSASDSQVR